MNRHRSAEPALVLAVSSLMLGAICTVRAAASSDEPPQPKVNLAYDLPLPDSVEQSPVDITVLDAATRAPIILAEVLVLNYIDLNNHRFPTNRQGQLRVAYPYAGRPN